MMLVTLTGQLNLTSQFGIAEDAENSKNNKT